MFDLENYKSQWIPSIDELLNQAIATLEEKSTATNKLTEAMKHALLQGGKRLRPLAVLAAIKACGKDEASGVKAACAIEFIHAYSLVHDDLPSMDDDDFRRGKPSCHKAFGEAMAILAGDALLTHAFYLLADSVPVTNLSAAIRLVSAKAGALGMVGGQADDISDTGIKTAEDVERVHTLKTAALFEAAVRLGGLVADASDEQLEALSAYAQALGLAFQIADDLLSFSGDEKALGRPTGSDKEHDRRT